MPSTRDSMYLGGQDVGGGLPDPPPYVRPADWLPLPEVLPGQQKFVGLVAVHDTDSNLVGLTFSGAYTVDWGDGSALQNVATGITASHAYKWANVPASTLTSRGYRQAIVTVIPQGAGNFTSIILTKHASARTTQMTKWLDIRLGAPMLTSLTVSPPSPADTPARMLEQFEWVGTSILTNMSSMFYNCSAFQKLIGGRAMTANATNFGSGANTGMFQYCYSLTHPPDMNTSKGTTFQGLFQGCYSLHRAPTYDFSKATNLNSVFANCEAMVSAPAYDVRQATDLTSMFGTCRNLRESPALTLGTGPLNLQSTFVNCPFRTIPLYNTGTATSLYNTFANCTALESIPALDLSKATTVRSMFSGCAALQYVPDLNAPLCTTFERMFTDCDSLKRAPNITMGTGALSLYEMFSKCHSLKVVPTYNTATATDFTSMFWECWNLIVVPALNMTAATAVAGMFLACTSLERILVFGSTKGPFSLTDTNLAAAELNEFYTNLGTANGAQVVTNVSPGNWGSATDTPAIATAKGWTVS